MARITILFVALIFYSATLYCQVQVDSALQQLKKIPQKYAKRGDSVLQSLQKTPDKYLKKGDSVLESLQKTPEKYLKQGDSIIANFKKIPIKYVKKGDSLLQSLQRTPDKYLKRGDSVLESLQKIPIKYLNKVDTKIDKYSSSITNKSKKTLEKLSRWENKIHLLLVKVSPETDARLFGKGQMTFSVVLQKLKEGKSITETYKAQYNQYRDKLTSSLKYIETQKDKLSDKYIKSATEDINKISKLETDVANSEALEQFIRDRKNQLIDQSIKYIGKSKYLIKMNKEAYYYADALRNYKEVFSDPKKVEEIALKVLNGIPEFKNFAQASSPLSNLFTSSSGFSGLSSSGSVPIVNGLATRASLQQYMQANAPFLNTKIVQQLQTTPPVSPFQLDQLKNKINSIGGMGNSSLPEIKPNTQKNKPFKKRLEYGLDLQFGKSVDYIPALANVGVSIGYKLNNKSSAGIGLNYKMGLGHGWDHIKLTSEGLGLRTYLKWKLKRGFYMQGSGEWNYMLRFKRISELKNENAWNQTALLGLCKQYSLKKKLKGNVQFLYDFFYQKHSPHSQPLIFRFGYGF